MMVMVIINDIYHDTIDVVGKRGGTAWSVFGAGRQVSMQALALRRLALRPRLAFRTWIMQATIELALEPLNKADTSVTLWFARNLSKTKGSWKSDTSIAQILRCHVVRNSRDTAQALVYPSIIFCIYAVACIVTHKHLYLVDWSNAEYRGMHDIPPSLISWHHVCHPQALDSLHWMLAQYSYSPLIPYAVALKGEELCEDVKNVRVILHAHLPWLLQV